MRPHVSKILALCLILAGASFLTLAMGYIGLPRHLAEWIATLGLGKFELIVALTIIFWLGLKVETDWPEALGAFMIAGSVAAFEFIAGWSKFELGLIVVPYLIPIAVFVLLLMYGMRKSV